MIYTKGTVDDVYCMIRRSDGCKALEPDTCCPHFWQLEADQTPVGDTECACSASGYLPTDVDNAVDPDNNKYT